MIRIATWNINSVRLRADQVARFVAEQDVDVVCLQEIKCRTEEFPSAALKAAGMPHLRVVGQKGWHGVAIASRLPLEDAEPISACNLGHARVVAAKVKGVEIQNFYIPAGGDVADPEENPKFAHKLRFYERLRQDAVARDRKAPMIWTGDFNIAPSEFDVWNHNFMSKVVSHTPIEVDTLNDLQAAGGFTDVVRRDFPEDQKLASWWSYRAKDFRKTNRGLRLDHIWASQGLTPRVVKGSARIHEDCRAWERPSDHAPVTVDIDA